MISKGSGDEFDFNEPPALEQMERLAALIRLYNQRQRESKGFGKIIPFGDLDPVAEELDRLKMGSPPPGLHDDVRKIWESLATAWASKTTMADFESQLKLLLDPLDQTSRKIAGMEKEVERDAERLETLRALDDLLEELLRR
jgi:HPt (histidine-containing phosphotransfer) domain-containing protein